jgi:hypothetical protein
LQAKGSYVLHFDSEGFLPSKYKDADKIKAMVIFLHDNARVYFDTLNRDRENCGLGCILTWSAFKQLFLHQFLYGNYRKKHALRVV